MLYYPFDSCSGTSPEGMGTRLDATLVGDASCSGNDSLSTFIDTEWTSGTSLELDGEGDYAEAPDDPRFEPSQLTISAWIYSDDFGWGPPEDPAIREIMSKGSTEDPPASNGYRLCLVNGAPSLIIAGDSGETSLDGSTLSASTWHHLAATFDGSIATLYVDGVLDASATFEHGIFYGDESFLVGAMTDRRFDFYGYIDEVSLWDYAKTPEEVADLYESYHCP